MAEVSMAEATLQVFRGDREGGKAVDYRVPLVPGMVVLDALHSDSGAPGARPGRALELQGGQMRLLLGRGQRPPAAHLQDAHGRASSRSSPSPSFP